MYSPFMHGGWSTPFVGTLAVFVVIAALWSVVWKGLALWSASQNQQRAWFVVLLIVNTMGILEIIYLLLYRKDKEARSFASLFSMPKKEQPGALPVAELSPAE